MQIHDAKSVQFGSYSVCLNMDKSINGVDDNDDVDSGWFEELGDDLWSMAMIEDYGLFTFIFHGGMMRSLVTVEYFCQVKQNKLAYIDIGSRQTSTKLPSQSNQLFATDKHFKISAVNWVDDITTDIFAKS